MSVSRLQKKHAKTPGFIFAVDTLEFLHRGGRIGGAQRFIGSALNLKPILALEDGKVEGVERIRTKSKAHDRLIELVAEKVKGKSNIRLASLHANASEDAKALLDRAAQQLNPVETIFAEVSPVVGTHTGPGLWVLLIVLNNSSEFSQIKQAPGRSKPVFQSWAIIGNMSHNIPLVIGIAGGSGSGKTTVAQEILNRVGADRIAYLQHDSSTKT